MKQLKKWLIRLIVTGLFITGLLLLFILNPVLLYANKTAHNNFTIYHNETIDSSFFQEFDKAAECLHASEFYKPDLKLDICLNDGSLYPALIQKIRGRAFAWGFYNKVVMQGTLNCQNNYVVLNGYKWNMMQLLAHEMIHCLQFDKLGFFKSNPAANIPEWKWEGYAEYIARKNDLAENIEQLSKNDRNDWAVTLVDNTIAPRTYYDYMTLVQYCMDVKKMSYQQVLAAATEEKTIRKEMMNWYNSK